MADKKEDNRASMLPQVEKVLQSPELKPALEEYRRDAVVRMVRKVIDGLRQEVSKGKRTEPTEPGDVASMAVERLNALNQVHPARVINGTGIVLHTNLGRSIISEAARNAIVEAAGSYCDLEIDMETGNRTRRDIYLEKLLLTLFDAESATVVNNNAAAVMLTLNTLAEGKEVITSRGELIEIGGSFRVPDVVSQSGAILKEVGTTNRVHLKDYEAAINENTALILKTHTSNYRVVGFHQEISTEELVGLGKKHDIPVVYDLGSGYVAPEEGSRIDEPDIAGSLAEGPDVVTFSGDKLLWGTQAGIALGKKKYIEPMRKNSLWRVVRIDKLVASGLYVTLLEHMKGKSSIGPGEMEWLRTRTMDDLISTAEELASKIRDAQPKWKITVADGASSFGGGSVPGQEFSSKLVTIEPEGLDPGDLDRALRTGNPPIAGYFQKGIYVINVLTLLPGDVDSIAERFREIG
jgi:L-seryl-tRNA(Ser) seleniumtransferase